MYCFNNISKRSNYDSIFLIGSTYSQIANMCATLDFAASTEYDNLVRMYEFAPTTLEEIKAIVCESSVKCSFPDSCPYFILKII